MGNIISSTTTWSCPNCGGTMILTRWGFRCIRELFGGWVCR